MDSRVKHVFIFLGILLMTSSCDWLDDLFHRNKDDNKDDTAVFIGTLYYYANPLNERNGYEQLNSFIGKLSNPQKKLGENSEIIKSMKRAGEKLIAAGIQSYSSKEADEAWSRAVDLGASEDQANHIRDHYNDDSVDKLTFGEELVWLSEVMPDYINGETTKFYTTGTEVRQQIRSILPLIELYGAEEYETVLNAYEDYLIYYCAEMVYEVL